MYHICSYVFITTTRSCSFILFVLCILCPTFFVTFCTLHIASCVCIFSVFYCVNCNRCPALMGEVGRNAFFWQPASLVTCYVCLLCYYLFGKIKFLLLLLLSDKSSVRVVDKRRCRDWFCQTRSSNFTRCSTWITSRPVCTTQETGTLTRTL